MGLRSRPPERAVARFEVALPDGLSLLNQKRRALAIAPDDSAIALVAGDGTTQRLPVRFLGRTDIQPLVGTDNAWDPFFSPDGRWLGFFADGGLKKVSVADGTVVDITAAGDSSGASWAPDGTIVLSPGPSSGLIRVSSEGGASRPLTTRDSAAGEAGHSWPYALPDGEHVLYTIEHAGRPFDEASIAVVSLQSDESGRDEIWVRSFPDLSERWQITTDGGTRPLWSRDGRELFYLNPGMQLMAVPVRAEPTFSAGNAELVFPRAYFAAGPPGRIFDVSPDGERFLMIKRGVDDAGDPPELILIQNWVEQLKRLVPVE